MRTLALLALTVFAFGAQAAPQPPQPFSAKYTVHADGFKIGEMQRSVEALGAGRYVLETTLWTTGIVAIFKKDKFTERSTWTVGPDRHIPEEYHSRYTGRHKDVVERITFDWNRNVVRSLRDGKEKELPIEIGVMDKLSYQVLMRDDLAKGLKTLHYQVADRHKIEDYTLEVVGEERVKTSALGTVRTIKIKKGTTTLWCAPELDFLPVRITQKDDGHELESELVSFHRKAAPPTVVETATQP